MKTIKALYTKYREIISYLFFGVLSMVLNIAAYDLCYYIFGISNVISTVIAWFLAVVMAFITNKLWVFESRKTTWQDTLKEALSFLGFRILSGVFDVGIMFFSVDLMHWNAMLWKIISNVIVVILNYIFSKFIIFKPEAKAEQQK